ncbi:MAG: HNH endonuclease, partial [Deltaproteobacteria bacterium]|nr:HNH endonuclease [Deltaproteobacteria bacterium]
EAYASLFTYVVQKYHYSEGAAYRRIEAAKVYSKFPEVIEAIGSGKINLTTLSLISPHLKEENASLWIHMISGKSKREVEDLLRDQALKTESRRDSIRRLPVALSAHLDSNSGQKGLGPLERANPFLTAPTLESKGASLSCAGPIDSTEIKMPSLTLNFAGEVTPQKEVKISFVADETVANKIERAKEILRHLFPKARLEDIFNQALEDLLEKRDPERKLKRREIREVKKQQQNESRGQKGVEATVDPDGEKRRTQSMQIQKSLVPSRSVLPTTLSRYIPMSTKQEVWKRDEGKCTYQSPEGKRCNERAYLEVDHIEPFALGGKAELENLRLLCSTHNRYRAQLTFGKQWRRAFE